MRPSGCDTASSSKHAHDVRERVRRAQMAEVLAAEPAVAIAAAAHEPRDVGELDGRRHPLARRDGLRQGLDAIVRDGGDPDVRRGLHRGVARDLGMRARERVEERRLAGIGQADDADLETRHQTASNTNAVPVQAPTTRPATTSETWCTARYTREAAIRMARVANSGAAIGA